MSEYTPLTNDNDNDVYYVEVNDDSIIPSFIKDNAIVKYSFYSIFVMSIIALIYGMIIILPSLAPEGVQIPDIPMVADSNVYLHPISSNKIKGKNPDPDDPIKIIPDFARLSYIDSKSNSIVRNHLKNLSLNDPNLDDKLMKKRIILIGDVHGCLKQLKKFLTYVKYDGGKNDHVILLGDFMNKGPDSIALLDYVMDNKIDAILGNHEIAMLKRYTQFHGLKSPLFYNDLNNPETNSTLSIRESYDLDELMKLAKKLTPQHIDFLSSCSPIRTIGPVPHYYNEKQSKHAEYPANGVIVHAGLLWNKDINNQNIDDVTTMRNLLPPNWDVPTDDRHDKFDGKKSVAWTKIWNEYQLNEYNLNLKNLTADDITLGTKVYYGHDAKRGVVTKEFSNGLDSGCVYGKQLSGVIIWSHLSNVDGKDQISYKQMTVDVNC